jgi:hypothetical protein
MLIDQARGAICLLEGSQDSSKKRPYALVGSGQGDCSETAKKIQSISVQKERAKAAAQASIKMKMSFFHPGSLCIVSNTIVIFICHE